SGGVVAYDVLEARIGERGEGRTLGCGDVGRPFEGGHVPHVVILRGNVEITDVGDLRVGGGGEPGGTRIAKSLQPAQHVGVVVMPHRTPVGYVQAPHLDTTPGGCDGSGLGFLGVTVAGLSGKADLYVRESDPGGDRQPVPLGQAVVGHFVPAVGED